MQAQNVVVEDVSHLGPTGNDNSICFSHSFTFFLPILSVPVYDARYVTDFKLQDWADRLDTLPRFDEELPPSALTLIGFNPVVYEDKARSVSNIQFYLLWVILLDYCEVDDGHSD